FYHLRKELECELQVGATDQWGNITVGTELARKKLGATVWGLVFPLLTRADGSKYGKTATGTVWLDPRKTHPNDFYQFFLKADDADVIKLLKTLTFLERDTIEALAVKQSQDAAARSAQKSLAWEMTKIVHGEQLATEAKKAAEAVYGKISLKSLPEAQLDQVAASLPHFSENPIGKTLTDAVALSGLAPSKGQARQLILAGGVYMNGDQYKDPKLIISPEMLLLKKYLFMQKGTSQNVVYTAQVPPAGVHPSVQQ
ncbi:MAG TPA: tyrosine--tRNA ligase, partial [Lacunisphaera sp.]|nr:tyrosine--tRNA ligase [Lacunisphaera sp.]